MWPRRAAGSGGRAGGADGQRVVATLLHTGLRVEALARYFGVAPGHFFADGLTDAATGDAEGLVALRSPEVRRLAVRAVGLSERSRRALAELANALGEVEAATGRTARKRRAP